MKFHCKECGFTIEVPYETRECPICKASNTELINTEEIEKEVLVEHAEPPQPHVTLDSEVVEEADFDPVELGLKDSDIKKSEQNSVVSEAFFDYKPDADIDDMKALAVEYGGSIVPPRKSRLGIYLFAISILLFLSSLFIYFSPQSPNKVVKVVKSADVDKDPPIKKSKFSHKAKADNESSKKSKAVSKSQNKITKRVEKPKKKKLQEEKPKRVLKHKVKRALKHKVKKVKSDKVSIKRKSPKRKSNYKNFVNKGNSFLKDGNVDSAIKLYSKAIRINKRAAKAYRGLGISYASQGNYKKACINYRKYIKYLPEAKDRKQVEKLLEDCI